MANQRANLHMSTDYSQSEFLKRIGEKNPRPVVMGSELIVECDDGICVSREEALGEVGLLPTPDEIEIAKKKTRDDAIREGRIQRPGGKLPPSPGIREVPTRVSVPYRLEDY